MLAHQCGKDHSQTDIVPNITWLLLCGFANRPKHYRQSTFVWI